MKSSRSAKLSRDPLSNVLSALGARSVRGTRLEASGDWALSFQGRGRLKFVAIVRGQCWLLLPGTAPEALKEGDIFLLSNTSYTVASDPEIEPVDGMPLYESPDQDIVRLGDGGETVMVGGGSAFADGEAAFILEALPAFLRIDRASPGAGAVARTLALLEAEVGNARLGRRSSPSDWRRSCSSRRSVHMSARTPRIVSAGLQPCPTSVLAPRSGSCIVRSLGLGRRRRSRPRSACRARPSRNVSQRASAGRRSTISPIGAWCWREES